MWWWPQSGEGWQQLEQQRVQSQLRFGQCTCIHRSVQGAAWGEGQQSEVTVQVLTRQHPLIQECFHDKCYEVFCGFTTLLNTCVLSKYTTTSFTTYQGLCRSSNYRAFHKPYLLWLTFRKPATVVAHTNTTPHNTLQPSKYTCCG